MLVMVHRFSRSSGWPSPNLMHYFSISHHPFPRVALAEVSTGVGTPNAIHCRCTSRGV